MQKVIFFNSDVTKKNLASIVTDKNVDELISEGIIPEGASTVIKNYDETDVKLMYDIYHIDYLMFNDNISDVVLNKEMFSIFVLENYKAIRSDLFNILDALQTRAFTSGKPDVAAEIEVDKQLLRDMPMAVDFTKNKSINDYYSAGGPIELTINYVSKYESKLK